MEEIVRNNRFFLMLLSLLFLSTDKALGELPFEKGFSMPTMGSVIKRDGCTGRQPWISASFCDDTSHLNLSLYNTWYHSTILKAPESRVMRTGLGVRYSFRNYLNLKAAFSRLAAFSLYTEDFVYVSLSTGVLPVLRPGIQFNLGIYNIGIKGYDTKYSKDLGFSVVLLLRGVNLFIEIDDFSFSQECVRENQPFLRAGFSVSENKLGSQGAFVRTHFLNTGTTTDVSAGWMYTVSEYIGICAGYSTNPMRISFGFVITPDKRSYCFGLGHMTNLGWTQTLTIEPYIR